jgi:acetyl-CoA carboxylase biotin carboxyl carrier protein
MTSIHYPEVKEVNVANPNAQTGSLQLQTLTEKGKSQQLILSPRPGYYSDWPRSGTIITGGSFAGKLKVLNTYYDLYIPEDVYGQVALEEEKDFITPVAYGQELFRLNLDQDLFHREIMVTEIESKLKDVDTDTPEQGFVVRAFTTGIFYARPSPDSPPFVTPGQEIEKGKALGLIEIMKTFNHIIFQGTGKSDTGRVKKIYVNDTQEVKLGQPLFLIE